MMRSVNSRPLALIGMMGAGKSTVGALLAAQAGCLFIDLDQMVVERWQEDIADTFLRHGEALFRSRESLALQEAASRGERMVLATGGGAPLQTVNQRWLKAGFWVVWLDAPAELLYPRAKSSGRPLADDGWQAFQRRAEERRPVYANLAHLSVDVAMMSPEEAANEIRTWWQEQEESRGSTSH